MTVPYPQMSFLVQPDKDGYTAVAMYEDINGDLLPVEPRNIGHGITPPAALTRVITPIREQNPTDEEACISFIRFMVQRGIAPSTVAAKTKFTTEEIKAVYHGNRIIPAQDIFQIVEQSKLGTMDFLHTLREYQREQDK